MKPQRRLALKRERLAHLDGDAMRHVVGATHVPTDCNCITHGYSCDACPVPTLPINWCIVIDLTPACIGTMGCR
jgi:hypothetical protein